MIIKKPARTLRAATSIALSTLIMAVATSALAALDRGQKQASIVFQILASELALNQGDIGTAAATYLNLARQTQDPQAAKRATELAIDARSPKSAEEAAAIWLKNAPADAEAQGTLDLLQLITGDIEKLSRSLGARRDSAAKEGRLDAFYDYVAGLSGRALNKADGVRLYESVTEPDRDSPNILYTRAMLYERADQAQEMERLLRGLIAKDPNHAHAQNALGYHLADRNERLSEAFTLIERALSLAPTDPHIIDSMGWVYFRMGKLDLAEKYLREAHRLQPDAEISTHLAEVLWSQDKKADAENYFRMAFTANPRNEVLLETLKRLKVPPFRIHPQ